jgi:hypothetical protein
MPYWERDLRRRRSGDAVTGAEFTARSGWHV